jgi:ClpP class serine protease
VGAILLDIDSPGGETTGCFELSDYIYSVRGIKPIYAVANDVALSAAYGIASAASKVFVTRMGAVGSVGVYALHTEQSGFDKQVGVTYTYIHYGAKKVAGNPHEPLSKGAEADIQAEVTRQGDIFVRTVARNRRCSPAKIEALQAGLFWGDTAIPLLADEEGTLGDALNELRAIVQASNPAPGQNRASVNVKRTVTPVTNRGCVAQTSEPRAVVREEGKGNTMTYSNGKKTAAAAMQELEAQALVVARHSKATGASMANVYFSEESRGATKEQCMARALEAQPEIYEAYRLAHNAAPVVAALRASGIEIRER